MKQQKIIRSAYIRHEAQHKASNGIRIVTVVDIDDTTSLWKQKSDTSEQAMPYVFGSVNWWANEVIGTALLE